MHSNSLFFFVVIINSFVLLFLSHLVCVPAPVPRCSPFIIINKLAEFSNVLSDSNPYFPVPPCEYGGWKQAIRAGDYRATFVLAEPHKIPRHNFYELIWFITKGARRLGRIITGQTPLIADNNILNEGYRHYTPFVRTNQIGTKTHRYPPIIDDKRLYNKAIGNLLSGRPVPQNKRRNSHLHNTSYNRHRNYYKTRHYQTGFKPINFKQQQ